MGFLYPLFLVAGLTLAIPVLIHLFNLRRYKTVLFPHTRFLKSIQLHSRKQSQIRYKWLLLLRLLFLASLILAFAQPLLYRDTRKAEAGLQVIYLDNSPSMSLRKGARTLLDRARDAARQQVQAAATGARFILLTNDKPISYEPLPAERILQAMEECVLSPANRSNTQVLAMVQGMMQSGNIHSADLYYYSDFQRHAFTPRPGADLLRGLRLHAVPVQATDAANVFIDTAFLTNPALQSGQNNQLVVRTRRVGPASSEMPVLQLNINGQIKSAASLSFDASGRSTDTLSCAVNDAGWQRMTLYINDASLRLDDTFRIAARSTPSLAVLVLNEGQPNPYIQAAFRSYSGFRMVQEPLAAAPADWKDFNLIIFNGITRLDTRTGSQMAGALQAGQSVCIFPGRSANPEGLNAALRLAGDIRISGLDTASQTAGTLQPGSDLVKDLFERIPENVQLPVATWHYRIQAGLTANQQSVLSFRNGDPFLARYTPVRGALYLCATPADIEAGNFPGSYFFVPFLYQMAMQARSGDVYALTAGARQPAFLTLREAGERNMVHLYGPGIDAIPPQRPNAGGVDVFVDATVEQPGYYRLAAASGDSAVVALNAGREESLLDFWDISKLRNQWSGAGASWENPGDIAQSAGSRKGGLFPLWKVCSILALLLLAAETALLLGGRREQTVATS